VNKDVYILVTALMLFIGRQEEQLTCQELCDEVHGYRSAARCKWFAYGPADATATASSLASL